MKVLNGPLIKDYLAREARKRRWLAEQLSVSIALLDRMMMGHVPSDHDVLKKLTRLLKCNEDELVLVASIPKRRVS